MKDPRLEIEIPKWMRILDEKIKEQAEKEDW